MKTDDDLAIASAIFIIMAQKKKKAKPKRKQRRWWSVSIFKNRERYNGNDLLNDLLMEPSGKFENFCRMASTDFEYLLQLIAPSISKQSTHLRRTISAKERFAVTLRFLASGDSYQSLSYLFKISPQLISTIVVEVCEALKKTLHDQVKIPATSDEWKKTADLFEVRWNFPHCVGAIDGKHVVIMCPIHSGSEYINYKGTFSIVLMALCDADYCITYSNIGSQGRISDGGVFNNSSLYVALENRTLNLPSDEPLPLKEKPVPYVIVGDNAFPLKDYLMVPYSGNHDRGTPERIFHYRLSRARRTIENVFGIMSAVFRVLRKPILLNQDKARLITECFVLLHNFLRRSNNSRTLYTPPGTFDKEINGEIINGSWRNETEQQTSFFPLQKKGIRTCTTVKNIRDEFAQYFLTTGKVEWQDKYQ